MYHKAIDICINIFDKSFQNDVCKLINVYNWQVCNSTCYKTDVDTFKKLSRYNFPQLLINETHFDRETKKLHIKYFNKWLNNANPLILSTSSCNHDMKFIATSSKDNKSLIYYILYYITKTFIYICICIFFYK
jgi:hypothetical protein